MGELITRTVQIAGCERQKEYRRIGWDAFNQRGIWEGRFTEPPDHWRTVVNTDCVRSLDKAARESFGMEQLALFDWAEEKVS